MTGLVSQIDMVEGLAFTVLLVNWLPQVEDWLPVILSAACIIGGCLAYLWFRKRETRPTGRIAIRHSLVIGLGIVLLVLVALVHIWRGKVEWIGLFDTWLRGREIHGDLLWSIVALTALYFLSRAVEHGLLRGATDLEGRHRVRRAVAWGNVAVLFLCLAFIWINGTQHLGLFLGFLGAGVALSLQETLLCIAGWVLIVVKKPFDVGDRIEISNLTGDVIDIRVFQTSLLEVGNWVTGDQSTGRILNIPNSAVFRGVNANYTKGFPFIWNEQTIVVTFESDWKRAKEIILKQAQEEAEKIEAEVRKQIEQMRRQYAIRYDRLTPTVYTYIAGNGVALTLRYLCPVRKRRGVAHLVNEGILEDLATESGIHLAYPTTRIYNAAKEITMTPMERPAHFDCGGSTKEGQAL